MDSPSPFGIKMADRISGKPLHIDISDLPMRKGVTTNRNKFVLGPSGSGKSFFMNHLVRQLIYIIKQGFLNRFFFRFALACFTFGF